MNICELGHTTHDSIRVRTKLGKLEVFDVAKYRGKPGFYCQGQDVLSENLTLEGQWEPHDTEAIMKVLKAGDRSKLVIDFGCHIGWYTIMAAQLGYRVVAIDGDSENLRLLSINAKLRGVLGMVTTQHTWIDANSSPLEVDQDIELVKIDLEGNDAHAVKVIERLLDRVANLYIEISPAFNGGYPTLVKSLTDRGFQAFYPDGTPFDDDFSLGQINLRFSR